MRRWIVGISAALLTVLVAVVALVWSVLAIHTFSDIRRALVSQVLTSQIGQPLEVTGDVSLVLGRVSRVKASGVRIPSEDMAEVNLAELASLEFDLNLMALGQGQVDLNNLLIDGLKVNLLKTEDGTTSWSERKSKANDGATTDSTVPEADTAQEEPKGDGLLAFLRSRTASFTDIQLIVDDQQSGFEFSFELTEVLLEQLQGGTELGVTGRGKVNDQPFAIDGSYPVGASFTTRATFSSVLLTFDGTPFTPEEGGGYTAQLDIDITALGDLLDVLKLERSFEGAAALSAKLTSRANTISVSDISTEIKLDKGQYIEVKGDIADMVDLDGIDLSFAARLFPENNPPAAATALKDIKLTSISTRIVSDGKALEFDDLLLSTNAFEQGLDQVGPVSIGRIRRTSEGQLSFENISLQAGPRDKPILTARGNIRNILELKQLDLAGEIDAPASLVLSSLGDDVAEAFGGIEASFALDDAQGFLSLTSLTAKSVNTEVWSLDTSVAVGDVSTLNGVGVDFDLGIANGAEFLSALKLKGVDTGPLNFSASILRENRIVNAEVGLGVGTTQLTGTLATSEVDGRPRIDAAVISEKLAISELQKAIAGLVELKKIRGGAAKETPESDTADEIELQPLVLPKEKGNPADLFNMEKFLLETDIFASINFKEISGVKGVTSVSSELVSKRGKARLGPLDLAYGGGFFKVKAQMDLVETPNLVSISGATSGWDFGEILDGLGVNIEANGKLRGNFNVTGNRRSIQTFVNSMYGSASVVMSEGQVATSLLELAGLGIFRWIFSEEIRQGYTDVVCVVAPVKISAGKVTFNSVVAETQSVQLVARGAVDWKRDTINLRAEPRPVGRPLARSAWPFEVTGKLSEPKFKLDAGGSRSARADKADEMPADRQPCKPDILQLE
jgi:uncharacterized protein involved in outer membrane biogenesis